MLHVRVVVEEYMREIPKRHIFARIEFLAMAQFWPYLCDTRLKLKENNLLIRATFPNALFFVLFFTLKGSAQSL